MVGFEQIDQVDGVVAAPAAALPDAGAHDGDGKKRFAAAGSADQDEIAFSFQEGAGDQFLDQGLVDRGGREVEVRIAAVVAGRHYPEFDDDRRGMVAMFGAVDIDWPEFRAVELS